MPDCSKKKPGPTRVYLPSGVIRAAKRHATRNGFTLSGWAGLLVKKALGRKTQSKPAGR